MDHPLERRSAGLVRRPTWVVNALVLVVGLAGAGWIQYGIHELRAASHAREAHLREFEAEAHNARTAPGPAARAAANRLEDCLKRQQWHRDLGAPTPRVDITSAGPVVRFTKGARR